MERLKVAALTSDNRRVMYLHSSMERLKEMIQQFSQQQQPNLHSSMERLKESIAGKTDYSSSKCNGQAFL